MNSIDDSLGTYTLSDSLAGYMERMANTSETYWADFNAAWFKLITEDNETKFNLMWTREFIQ